MLFDNDANSSQPILSVKWECEGDEQLILSCPVDHNVDSSQCDINFLGGVHCFGEMKVIAKE